MNLDKRIKRIAIEAKDASFKLATLSSSSKNKALRAMAAAIGKSSSYISSENEKDLKRAKRDKLSSAMIDRLYLSSKRMKEMSISLREIARLKDPLGEITSLWDRPNGLKIGKVRVPIGVIAIIYESRPNVTSDCIGLCLKSGNSVILRGGSEAYNSNRAIYQVLTDAVSHIIPKNTIKLIPTKDREALDYLLRLSDEIDLLIPRGGESLIRYVTEHATMPVIKHYKGVCHVFIDKSAKINMAIDIAFNAKAQRPGVCNAMETLIIHKDIAKKLLPLLGEKLKDAGVELRGCAKSKTVLPWVKKVREKDYYKEYLDLILNLKIVDSLSEAVSHINKYGSSHSDAIVTDDHENAYRFLREVDSACVYLNASTRFTDGFQFGMGAEMGISTDKIHARGPMALEELTTYKYIVFGNGQIRV
ncbi:MAG: glutamate-5-semialdehyde dehydrogenase [Candidatus Kaelpia aquatica]|nr:glutamate-5-semialdehyde dehydrogenase [Candidatus Kaelpia aquatica]